jgi:hypothetical protein
MSNPVPFEHYALMMYQMFCRYCHAAYEPYDIGKRGNGKYGCKVQCGNAQCSRFGTVFDITDYPVGMIELEPVKLILA